MNELKRIFLVKWTEGHEEANDYIFLKDLTKGFYESKFVQEIINLIFNIDLSIR